MDGNAALNGGGVIVKYFVGEKKVTENYYDDLQSVLAVSVMACTVMQYLGKYCSKIF